MYTGLSNSEFGEKAAHSRLENGKECKKNELLEEKFTEMKAGQSIEGTEQGPFAGTTEAKIS